MTYNKIYAVIGEERHIVLDPINYQYDVKQILVISGETVPDYYEADVCNVGDTATLTMVGTAADGVEIPDKFLLDGRNVLVYVVIPGSGGDVQTRYDITIPVDERAEREDIDPSEAEQQQIDSLINALNSGVGRAETAATAAEESATDAEGSAGEAEDQAENAEAWAVGQRAGEDVPDTDPTYHNNSKYYAGMAEAAAEEAGQHEASWETWVQRAESAADDAERSARAAAGAKADAEAAAQTATQKATEAGNSAAAAASSAASARQTVDGAIGAINTAKEGALTAIGSAGSNAVGAVEQAGTTQTGRVTTEGNTQVNRVQTKGDEVLDSIPQDYSDLVDDVADLTRQLSDLDDTVGNYLYSVTPAAGNWAFIPIADRVSAGTTIYAQALSVSSNVESVRLIGQYSGERYLIDLLDGEGHFFTTGLEYTDVKVAYKLNQNADGTVKYSAICLKSDDPVSLSKDLFDVKQGISKLSSIIDSPFVEQIDSKFKGIIGFEFFITGATDLNYSAIANERYRVTNIYYKDAGFYLHFSMERYKDGTWSGYDSVTITLANAPTETGLMFLDSTYGRFRLAIIPSLMQAGRATNVAYTVKNSAINPFCIKLRSEFDKYTRYDSFGLKDTIGNIVTVKQDGSGDYTTIGAAYDAIRAKSSFFNQYEICVYPGVYEEYNLIPPPYSHTHGMFPNTVTVTSEGKTGTLPVFDQKQVPSKLSNMKIISATGYCIHVDNPLIHSVVDTNLHCKKVYSFDPRDFGWQQTSNATILGMGAQPAGMRVVFDGCTFEDGEVVCHTMSASENIGDFYLEYSNCKLVNARIRLQKAGNDGAALYGHYVCKIVNLSVLQGTKRPGIGLWYGVQASGLDYNFGWQIIGGNVNTGVEFLKSLDSTAPDCWENVQLTEKTYIRAKGSITNGQWITDDMIPAGANETSRNIIGVALDNGTDGDTVPVWTGYAFFVDLTDGEYGTDANGNLSSSASEKIGKVKNGILYRYSM